jgi:hypothetical protein
MKIDRTEPSIIAYDEEVYSSFPDLVFFNGQFLCVYRESDTHHPTFSRLVLMNSYDGEKWDSRVLATATLADEGYVFNCPKLGVVNKKLVLSCDTKTDRQEKLATWNIYLWWSADGETWTDFQDTKIAGLVPDRIVVGDRKLIMGYHLIEQLSHSKRLVQMMAESYDGGITWRDRTTIAASSKNDFCEGSIVAIDPKKLLCYMRDNRGPTLRSQFSASMDSGKTWSLPSKLNLMGHRIVADIKAREPYRGLVIGTFRNTLNRNVSMFLHNLKRKRTQTANLDYESRDALFDFGYSGWAENKEGQILVVYYIQRHRPNPMICSTLVTLR